MILYMFSYWKSISQSRQCEVITMQNGNINIFTTEISKIFVFEFIRYKMQNE